MNPQLRHVARRGWGFALALVATAAVRDAANGAAFAERVKQELGIPLEVIDGETEARLAFLSVSEHFTIGRGRAVVADIGGGSLELVLAVVHPLRERLFAVDRRLGVDLGH